MGKCLSLHALWKAVPETSEALSGLLQQEEGWRIYGTSGRTGEATSDQPGERERGQRAYPRKVIHLP